jgi:uncharacterized protein YdhG (YjbR/CyaY superfamily)
MTEGIAASDGARAVDDYIAALPEDRRAPMTELRRVLIAAAPRATEAIAYDMPALRLNGAFFVSYDAYKTHYSLFPGTQRMEETLGEEIAPHVYGKGTLRFRADEALPLDLIRRIVEIRLEDFPQGG